MRALFAEETVVRCLEAVLRAPNDDDARAVLADALEASGTLLGQLCALQLRIARVDDLLHAAVWARLGSRDGLGPLAAVLGADHAQWRQRAESRVRERRVRWELLKVWERVLALLQQLESARENVLTPFSAHVSVAHGMPVRVRTTSWAASQSPSELPWLPGQLELVADAREPLGPVLQLPVVRQSPSLDLRAIGTLAPQVLPTGRLGARRLMLGATESVQPGLIRSLAVAGWLKGVERLRAPASVATEEDMSALAEGAPSLRALSIHSIPFWSPAPVAPLASVFSQSGFECLELEGVTTFTSRADWDRCVRPGATWDAIDTRLWR